MSRPERSTLLRVHASSERPVGALSSPSVPASPAPTRSGPVLQDTGHSGRSAAGGPRGLTEGAGPGAALPQPVGQSQPAAVLPWRSPGLATETSRPRPEARSRGPPVALPVPPASWGTAPRLHVRPAGAGAGRSRGAARSDSGAGCGALAPVNSGRWRRHLKILARGATRCDESGLDVTSIRRCETS